MKFKNKFRLKKIKSARLLEMDLKSRIVKSMPANDLQRNDESDELT